MSESSYRKLYLKGSAHWNYRKEHFLKWYLAVQMVVVSVQVFKNMCLLRIRLSRQCNRDGQNFHCGTYTEGKSPYEICLQ